MEIRKLNMLRGMAALIVVISHFSNSTKWLNGILGKGAGQFGVMIFFMLSGFLMSYLYMHKSFDWKNIRKYIISRFARVIPLFLIVVICSYTLQKLDIIGVLYKIQDEASLLSHLIFLSGEYVLWTIPTEIQFYVLFIFLWWLSTKGEGYLYVFLAFVFLALVFIDFPRPIGKIIGIPIDISLISALPYFFVGVVFGQIYRKWKAPNYLSHNIFVLALFIIPLLYPKIFIYLTGHEHEMWRDVGVLFAVSLVFFLILFLVPDKNTFLSNRIGDFLGKISYSLYLLHLPVLWQIEKLAIVQLELQLLLFLTCALSISYISFIIIERPLGNAIRSIISKPYVPHSSQ